MALPSVSGTPGNDTLYGTDGDDTLLGLAGRDSLSGGNGNDRLEGGDEPDVPGTNGDSLSGGFGNDTLIGGAGGDWLSGDGGDDVLDGGSGDDSLYVPDQGGNDTLSGGMGDDFFSISASNSKGAAVVTADGGAGDDVFEVYVDPDSGDQAILTGGAGSDTYSFPIPFGPMAGRLYGAMTITDFAAGAAGDRIDLSSLLYASSTVQLAYAGGNPFDPALGYLRWVQQGTSALLQYDRDGAGGESAGFQTVIELQNTTVASLTADNFVDRIDPSGGAVEGKFVQGTDADEFLYGGFFDDAIAGGGGADTISGRAGHDSIWGGDEDGAGDSLYGEAGYDALHGEGGDDYLDGGYGNDTLFGDDGNDHLVVGAGMGNDYAVGGEGNDLLEVFVGQRDGVQAVDAIGGGGDDEFVFFVNRDAVYGGDDTIRAHGGYGSDAFGFEHGFTGGVTIRDFQAGAGGDRIDASRLLAYDNWGLSGPVTGNPLSPANGFLRLVQDGKNTLIQYDPDGASGNLDTYRTVLTLEDVTASTLTADNFVGGYGPVAGSDGNFNGASGADIIFGSDAADKIYGLAGDDDLSGNGGDDLIEGGAGADLLRGGDGKDTLKGGDGNDRLDGGAGADQLEGGQGNDTYVINAYGDVVVEAPNGGTDKIVAEGDHTLGANFEQLELTGTATDGRGNALANDISGHDGGVRLFGMAGNDRLTGGAGIDHLDGGAGNDTMTGGAGDDQYRVDSAGDSVIEAIGGGIDSVITSLATYVLPAHVEQAWTDVAQSFTATGNALDNTLGAGPGTGILKGEGGNDRLLGGVGNDQLYGGSGDDILNLHWSKGSDIADGGVGSDTLVMPLPFAAYARTRPNATDIVLTTMAPHPLTSVTVRNVEFVEFSDGVKTLLQLQENLSSTGADNLSGTGGNDLLDGGLGKDTLTGGAGDDTYIVSEAGDIVVEEADGGVDEVKVGFGAAGTYTLAANVEHATVIAPKLAIHLAGNALNNTLTGNAAANTLSGGAGNDTLDGKAGNDTMIGGDGHDTYVVDSAKDVITELDDAGFDTVETALSTYTLGSQVERVLYQGKGGFTGTGNAGHNTLVGGDGADVLKGEAGIDLLIGGLGNDQLFGGLDNDFLNGGLGKDLVDGGTGIDQVILDGNFADYVRTRPNATDIVLTLASGHVTTVRNVELFRFADGERTLDEVIFNIASISDDVIDGTGGADLLDGGLGKDEMVGGDGDDTYVVSEAGDKVVELDGEGADTVHVAFKAAGTYVLADAVESALVTGALPVNVTGNGLDNVLTGNAGKNTLIGAGGNDVLNGGGGPDKLAGGVGDDVYMVDMAGDALTELAGEGIDRVLATAGAWTLGANLEELDYTGAGAFSGTGNLLGNLIEGGGGADKLLGMAGKDRLFGEAGADFLDGGLDDDVLDAGTGKDVVDGGAGNDVLHVLGEFADYVRSRPDLVNTLLVNQETGEHITLRNIETIVFANGERTLAQVHDRLGTSANDTMTGTAWSDTLDGGLGTDTLSGGDGDDMYIVNVAGDKVVE